MGVIKPWSMDEACSVNIHTNPAVDLDHRTVAVDIHTNPAAILHLYTIGDMRFSTTVQEPLILSACEIWNARILFGAAPNMNTRIEVVAEEAGITEEIKMVEKAERVPEMVMTEFWVALIMAEIHALVLAVLVAQRKRVMT